MKQTLENQKNLDIYQAEITEIIFDCENNVKCAVGVKTRTGEVFNAKTVIIASGTYLDSNILLGDVSIESGADNMARSSYLSENLKHNGVDMRRFKTGTPARVHSDSINYSVLEIQKGDDDIVNFSDETEDLYYRGDYQSPAETQRVCYITYTNQSKRLK